MEASIASSVSFSASLLFAHPNNRATAISIVLIFIQICFIYGYLFYSYIFYIYWGILNIKAVPFPSLLFTETVPSCASTMFLTIDKPSPVPFFFRSLLRDLSEIGRAHVCTPVTFR